MERLNLSSGQIRYYAYSAIKSQIPQVCRRLIKNAIVCWNYLFLSREMAMEKNEKRRAELIEAIRNGSAATWKHYNLHGEFDFSDEQIVDSMGLAVPKNPAFE